MNPHVDELVNALIQVFDEVLVKFGFVEDVVSVVVDTGGAGDGLADVSAERDVCCSDVNEVCVFVDDSDALVWFEVSLWFAGIGVGPLVGDVATEDKIEAVVELSGVGDEGFVFDSFDFFGSGELADGVGFEGFEFVGDAGDDEEVEAFLPAESELLLELLEFLFG